MLCSEKMKFKRLGSSVHDILYYLCKKILPISDRTQTSLKGAALLSWQLGFLLLVWYLCSVEAGRSGIPRMDKRQNLWQKVWQDRK